MFNEITKDAVLQAFDHPRKIDMDLVHSQETRRILDRIIGFKLSKLLKSKIRSKSAGRVQSVALKLIVEREKEIKAFVPEEYWTLDAKFKEDDKEFSAALAKIQGKKAEIKNKEQADEALAACQGPMTVTALKKQVRKKEAKPPLITSTLQQEASHQAELFRQEDDAGRAEAVRRRRTGRSQRRSDHLYAYRLHAVKQRLY